MNYIHDLTGRGELFGNPMAVLAITSTLASGQCEIVLAEGGAKVSYVVIGTAKNVAEYIDGLLETILNEEIDEDEYDNREDEKYGDD